MMRSRLDLPEPFRPSTPIFAPGKNEREMSLRMTRLGGTILPTRFIVKTYWAMCSARAWSGVARSKVDGEGAHYTVGARTADATRARRDDSVLALPPHRESLWKHEAAGQHLGMAR